MLLRSIIHIKIHQLQVFGVVESIGCNSPSYGDWSLDWTFDQAEHRPSHSSDLPASSRRTTVTSMLPSYHRRVDYKAQV